MLCWIYGLVVRSCMSAVYVIIVYRWKWLWSLANIKGAFKGAKIYVERSMTVHNHLFWAYTPCMNYAAKTFLLVSSWYRENNYCVLCTAKSKKVNKNLLKRNLSGFITIPNYDVVQHYKLYFFCIFSGEKQAPGRGDSVSTCHGKISQGSYPS